MADALEEPDGGGWIRASDVSLADLLAPKAVLAARAASSFETESAGGSHASEPARVAHSSHSSEDVPPSGALEPAAGSSTAAVAEYRSRCMKHITIMTPLVYVLVMGRHFFAAQLTSGSANFSLGRPTWTPSLAVLYAVFWAVTLSTAVGAAAVAVRRPGKRGKDSPRDGTLRRAILFDLALSSLNPTAMLEYATHMESECPAAASLTDCLLNSYFWATHMTFITKWVAASYPPRLLFMPELFRTCFFIVGAIRLVGSTDGRAAASSPQLVAGLLLRGIFSLFVTLVSVSFTMSPAFDHEAALPPDTLDRTCPRLLRPLRDTCCAAAAAVAYQLNERLGWKSQYLQLRGMTALAALIAQLNGISTLHAIGRYHHVLLLFSVSVTLLMGESAQDEQSVQKAAPQPAADSPATSPALSWSDVELGAHLGSGSFGHVYAATWRGTRVALKWWISAAPEVGGSDMSDKAALDASMLSEAALLMSLRHPNILTVYGVLPPPDKSLVMERGACTLRALMADTDKQVSLTWRRRCSLALGIAAGVEYLHAHTPAIVHGDLTCSNVIICDDGTPKLADFGMAWVTLRDGIEQRAGCLEYAAPEVVRRLPSRVPQASDVFSFGVVLHRVASHYHLQTRSAPRLATGEHGGLRSGGLAPPSLPHRYKNVALSSASQPSKAEELLSNGGRRIWLEFKQLYAAERGGYVPKCGPTCPPQLAALIAACCAIDPAARPTARSVRRQLEEVTTLTASWTPLQ